MGHGNNPFQNGNQVVCIDGDTYSPFDQGEVYTVIHADDEYVTVQDDDGEVHHGWRWDRFELVTDEETSTPQNFTAVVSADDIRAFIVANYGDFNTDHAFDKGARHILRSLAEAVLGVDTVERTVVELVELV